MILSYQKIELLNKTVFEYVKFTPPLKATEIMENEACLIYAINGKSQVYGSEESTRLTTGESVLMKCGNFINHWQRAKATDPYEAVAIHFYPDVIKVIFEHQIPAYLQAPANQSQRTMQKMNKNIILKSYIDSLLMYFENPMLFNEDTIKLKLRELISLLYNMDSYGVREVLSDLFNPQQIAFKKVITKHLFHDLSLQEYASLLNISLSTFKRKFRHIYQMAPGQYIQAKKLEKAAQMLASSRDRVSNICFDCGFGDVSNFTKAFTKKYGQSPSAYQSQHLN